MRLLLLLLLAGCAPDRYGAGVDYHNRDDSFTSTAESYRDDSQLQNVVDVDFDPYWVGKVWAEWDWVKNTGTDLGYLHRHEDPRPLPPLPTPEPDLKPDPHEDHSWWQEQIESVLKFDADKLLIIALLAMFFRKDIIKLLPSWIKGGKGNESSTSV